MATVQLTVEYPVIVAVNVIAREGENVWGGEVKEDLLALLIPNVHLCGPARI